VLIDLRKYETWCLREIIVYIHIEVVSNERLEQDVRPFYNISSTCLHFLLFMLTVTYIATVYPKVCYTRHTERIGVEVTS
jgi:hypothetical protein